MMFSYGQYLLATSLALVTHVSIVYLLLSGSPADAPSAGNPMAITLTTTGSAAADTPAGLSKPVEASFSPPLQTHKALKPKPQQSAVKPPPQAAPEKSDAPAKRLSTSPLQQAVAPPAVVPLQKAPEPKPQQSAVKPPPQAAPEKSDAPVKRLSTAHAKPVVTRRHDTGAVEANKSSTSARGGTRDAVAAPLGGNAPPHYPNLARRRGYQGQVVVRVSVQTDGAVGNAVISKSSGYKVLDEAALEAVKKWRFRPAQRAGKSVDATLDVPVVFQLEKG